MMGAIADGFYLVEFVGVESREKQLDLVVEIMRGPQTGYRIGETFDLTQYPDEKRSESNTKSLAFKECLDGSFDVLEPERALFFPFIAKIVDGMIASVHRFSNEITLPARNARPRAMAFHTEVGWIWEDLSPAPDHPWRSKAA